MHEAPGQKGPGLVKRMGNMLPINPALITERVSGIEPVYHMFSYYRIYMYCSLSVPNKDWKYRHLVYLRPTEGRYQLVAVALSLIQGDCCRGAQQAWYTPGYYVEG